MHVTRVMPERNSWLAKITLSPTSIRPLEDRISPPYTADFPGDIVRFRIEDPDTGFKCVIYQNLDKRELIVAMGGTDGTDIKDWWGNVTHYGWNQWATRRLDILEEIDKRILEMQGPKGEQPAIYFTGQSLGGALAQYAGYEFAETHLLYPRAQLSLVTFNALGGIAALQDEIPNRDLSALNTAYAGFRDADFPFLSRLRLRHHRSLLEPKRPSLPRRRRTSRRQMFSFSPEWISIISTRDAPALPPRHDQRTQDRDRLLLPADRVCEVRD